MDRQGHEYAAALAFAQQQQQQQTGIQQQQQFGYHPPPHQFPHQMHGAPFIPPHPSLQQFPIHHNLVPQQQLYPHPMLHQQQPPPAFPPHVPPHHVPPSPYMHLFDSPPPLAPPPVDPELHKRIDKLVEYAAKNGPEFEAMIREKQHDNPEYSFLFGGEGHGYYRYKLWISTRPPGSPFNPPPFPTSSVPVMPSLHNPMMSSSPLKPTMGPSGASVSMFTGSHLQQPSFPPFYDQHQPPPHFQPFMPRGVADYEASTKSFKGLSGPLPSDVAVELNDVLSSLTGTKESIKGAKMWFMQRSPFAPALAEALRNRIFALDDSERQLHIIFLANDILFDSLQRRRNPQELDNEALAFKPVLGSMLSRIYNNPQNNDANQSRLEKILHFWASKEVYDQETINYLENEMTGGLPLRSTMKDAPITTNPSSFPGVQQTPQQWQSDKQNLNAGIANDEEGEKQLPPASVPQPQFAPQPTPPFLTNQLPSGIFPPVNQVVFPGSVPLLTPQVASQPSVPLPLTDQTLPPYPLFPPGLIPGMVRKMQIGSGVPYSPLSPLDIPTSIPPSTVSETEVIERVSKFFKEIGESASPEGPMYPPEPNTDEYECEREPAVRKGGACIPPPANLQQLDPETGMYPDGSIDRKPGSSSSGRLGLGATDDPNECQYDDVYSSYRKQRSTTYHSSMSARTPAK